MIRVKDPKYGDIPPAGMMNPDTSYLERFNNTVTVCYVWRICLPYRR